MGPWGDAIISVASLLALVIAVFGFRGLVEAVDGVGNRCPGCGKNAMWPLPAQRHECWHCRHAHRSSTAA